MKNKVYEQLKDITEVTKDKDMSEILSFRAGGKADIFIEPGNEKELIGAVDILDDAGYPAYIMGNGTNILVRDGGFRGCIVRIGNSFSRIDVDDNRLICQPGALLSVTARVALNEELTGFEFASGIPGSIGGAVFMNAGAYDGEMKNIVRKVRLYSRKDREIKVVSADELDLGYRHSIIQETGDIVLSVEIELEKGKREEISAKMKDLAERRNSKQPVQYPSAGSFFKRPKGYFAGKLIQDAGLKGLSVGDAEVSTLHSGFIINRGKATATDIIDLMHLVQNTVYDKFGVMMEPEVRIIGED